MVRGDEFHLRQVVRNLIDNALKFTPNPGQVTVAVRADLARKQARLTVSDTGAGIAAEDVPRIFDRFYRGDKSRRRREGQGGYGLGLSICQTVVRAMGGDVKVESQLGRGTTFTVTLPMVCENVTADLVHCRLAATRKREPRACLRLHEKCLFFAGRQLSRRASAVAGLPPAQHFLDFLFFAAVRTRAFFLN